MDLLPDELLADILGHLAPGSLAVSRCVCKDWCAVIDARRLLRADLLPLRLDGFFCLVEPYSGPPGVSEQERETAFFARPSTGRRIRKGHLDLLWDDDHDCHNPWLLDHCNGLVLLFNDVILNPATGQSVSLPLNRAGMSWYTEKFLAYDPIVSPYYEVVLIPMKEVNKELEWSSTTFTTHVFSSRKWMWEERSFVREGEAAEIIADMGFDYEAINHRAAYFRGALYLRHPNNSIMRITLWNDRYQILKYPAESQVFKQRYTYLGKSQNGVYCALFSDKWSRFRVWLLNESCGEMEWVLKNDINLQPMVKNSPVYDYNDTYSTPWIVNYEKDVNGAQTEDESEWDFDRGVVLHETKDTRGCAKIIFLGFHPYKEIAFFLVVSFARVVSYDLNSSKIQELGILDKTVLASFPYTACWMDESCLKAIRLSN